ncbi:sensor histidine kinase [Aquincola tertiaricarbonis]|uniref:sensor histidine kinase n=1 Tax=Aquincola tertiaricarbonis TaxID=391953 RepID=UPI000614B868|nr:histidine kinase dimerization/phospho-acceptor domain-containing protein [Aquincola tertiaricarbonis]
MRSDPLDLPSGIRFVGWLPAALVLAALMTTSVLGLQGLSVARSYVATEGLWTKAAFRALLSLERYAAHGLSEDREEFDHAVQLPLTLRAAREALDRADAPLSLPAHYFVEAGVNAADATAMCYLYRLARTRDWTRETVARWIDGDAFIDRLLTMADRIPPAGVRPLPETELATLRSAVQAQSDRFMEVQGRFAERVSERARWTAEVSMGTIVVLAAVLAIAAALHGVRWQRREAMARAALQAAHQRLRVATQSDHLGVFEWELGAPAVRLDARCCELYGVPCQGEWTVADRSVLRPHVHPDDQPALRQAMEQAAQQRRLFKHRYRVLPSPSQVRHLEITGMCTSALGHHCMVGVVRDISDEVQRGLAESQARTEEVAARTRSRLLSRLSHELRTPLNAILGFTQVLLADHEGMGARQLDWLQRIDDAGRGLLRMVEDVLRITLVTGGGLRLQHEPVALQAVVQSALQAHAAVQRSRQVGVDLSAPAHVVLVRADRAHFQEALSRLIEHVVLAALPDTRVRMEVVADDLTVQLRLQAAHWPGSGVSGRPGVDDPPSQQLGFALSLVEALLSAMDARLDVQVGSTGTPLIVVHLRPWPPTEPTS